MSEQNLDNKEDIENKDNSNSNNDNLSDNNKEIEEKLIQICEEVEKNIEAKNRSRLEQKVIASQQEWKKLINKVLDQKSKEEFIKKFQAICDAFFDKQEEYWKQLEWEKWANLKQKKELCELVEALSKRESLDEIADKVREAQNKWKEIGPVLKDKSDEIWNRFKICCDNIYKKCLDKKKEIYEELKTLLSQDVNSINWKETTEKVLEIQDKWNKIGFLPQSLERNLRESFQDYCNKFFENKKAFFGKFEEKLKENLEIKSQLCLEAESLANSFDWNSTSFILKELQADWKKIGPVPKKESEELWRRFQSACNSFFDKMEQEKPKNLKKKEALCEKIEKILSSLANNEGNLEKVTKQVIDMQKRWKEIGPVPEEFINILWKRFQTKCDEFFALKKEKNKELDSKLAENQVSKENLIKQAENIVSKDFEESLNWKDTADKLKHIQAEWKKIGPASRKNDQELWKKFQTICDSFFDKRKKYFEELDKSKSENLQQKEILCLSLEVLAKLVFPEANLEILNKPETMAQQLNIGLEYKNSIVIPGNSRATRENALKKAKDIQDKWEQIGHVPYKNDKELWERYKRALDLFMPRKFKKRFDNFDNQDNNQ